MPTVEIQGSELLNSLLLFHGLPLLSGSSVNTLKDSAGLHGLVGPAREAGLQASVFRTRFTRLASTPLPAIAQMQEGSLVLLLAAQAAQVLVQRPGEAQVAVISAMDFRTQWTGTLLLARPEDATGENSHFGFGWFFRALSKFRPLVAQVLLASLALQLLGLASPLVFQVVVDKVLVNRTTATLDVLMVALVLIGLFEFLLGGLRAYILNHTTSRVDVELGMRLFRHLVSLPLGYFQARRAGVTVARVRELDQIRNFLTSSAMTLVVDALFTVVFLVVMALYSIPLTAIVLVSLPIYVATSLAVGPAFRALLLEKFRTGAENQSFLVEAFTGIETVKSLAAEGVTRKRWEERLVDYVAAGLRVAGLGAWASQAIQLISKLATAAVLFVGAKQVMAGHMTVGDLVAFNMLAQRVAQPVLRLAQMWQDFHQTRVSVLRIGDIMNTPSERAPGFTGLTTPRLSGPIRFDAVNFRYAPDRPPVLRDLCLQIAEGEVIGIVGGSGSGKSTVAKLIQGMLPPEQGRVTIGGLDVSSFDPSWLRSQVGVVMQESILFNGTILSNIGIGQPGATLERVMEAARMAGAHDFIMEMPGGYQATIAERGASLSGGQRQRIAIARTLLSDPAILVLDEATSALDYESEAAIQNNMRQICVGRTVIVIAHRLSTVRHADRIITLEKGQMVEQGPHDELIRQGGRYARLFELQSGLRVVA